MRIITGQYSEPLITFRRRAKGDHTVGVAVVRGLRKAVSHLNENFQLKVDPTALVESQIFPSDTASNDRTPGDDVSLRVVFVPDTEHKNVLGSHVSEMSEKMKQAEGFLAIHDEISRLNKRVGKMERSIERMGREIEGMEKENKGMKENKGIKQSIERLEKASKRLDRVNERLEKANERLESEHKGLKEQLERLEKSNERLEKSNERLEKELARIDVELSREKEQRVKDMETIGKLIISLTPIHLRVLLDLTRQEILKTLGCETWEDLRGNSSVSELSRHIYQTIPRTLSKDVVHFICAYNHICPKGNMGAHQATQEEIRAALTTTDLLYSKDRRLEEMYKFVFKEDV